MDKKRGESNETDPQLSWELNPGVISERLEKEGMKKDQQAYGRQVCEKAYHSQTSDFEEQKGS